MPGRARVALLGTLPVAAAGAALVLIAIAASMMSEAEDYLVQFQTSQQVSLDQVEFEHYNNLQINASTLTMLATPLLFVALVGTFLLLAVLFVRRDAKPGPRRNRTAQAEATAAS